MAVMTSKTIVFKNKKNDFLNSYFVLFLLNLLPSLVNYRSHMTILSSKEGSSLQNLMLYRIGYEFTGFDTGIFQKK